MLRSSFVLPLAIVVWAIAGDVSLAADGSSGWPALDGLFSRGPGSYLSHWKLIITALVFFAWVRTTDWISQDAQTMNLNWGLWNAIAFGSYFLALLMLWVVTLFPVGLALLLIGYLAPLITYIVLRNGQALPQDKILTPRHIKQLSAGVLSKVGIKVSGAEVDARDAGPQIKLTPLAGATERDNSVSLLTSRQSPGWRAAKELLDDALLQRATHIMLDFTTTAVTAKYQIDGVWHDREPIERDEADNILAVYKTLAHLKVEDRRGRQANTFGMEVDKDKYTVKITTAGTQTGERALVVMEPKKTLFKNLEELGMRPKMIEQFEAILGQQGGLFVFSALPGGGMSTTFDTVVANSDRFLRSFATVCELTKPEREIENLHVTNYTASAGETPATVLPKLIRTYPDVIAVRDIADKETLAILCEQSDKRLLLTSVRAKEAVEALLRLLMLKVPAPELAAAVTGVLNVRLVRKLCEQCKEPYAPPAEVLKQLGLPAGKIEALYRPPTIPTEGKVVICEHCQGLGYFGRTGIFELLTVDDTIRQALITSPKLDALKLTARKLKHRSLQEEGVLLVARGVTSLQELLRVLKQ